MKIQHILLEYSIRATGNASAGALYCFRLTDAGSTTLLSYPKYAMATLQNIRKDDFQFIGF